MAAHLGNLGQMAWLLELVATDPARAIGLGDYGLREGCRAALVVLDAHDPAQAITEQAEKLYVIKGGVLVARNTRTSEVRTPRRCGRRDRGPAKDGEPMSEESRITVGLLHPG